MNRPIQAIDLLQHGDLGVALQMQRAAYIAQPLRGRSERLADLNALERLVREQQSALVQAVDADYGGRSAHETLLTEIMPVLASIKYARKHLRSWMRPQRRHVDRIAFGLLQNRVQPQPLGVVGVIVPWNFPINLSLVPLVFILAAGNRAMVKMSENSRHLAQLLIKVAPQYFPPERLQFFDETGGVGVAFSQLKFDHLLFTGSGATGSAVMAAAAKNLVPVTLELGGKCPAIVADDFDIALAAQRIMHIKCLNAGQICTSVDHVFVPRAKVAAFVQHAQSATVAMFDGLSSSDYTSIIDERAYQRLRGSLQEAQAQGAELVPLFNSLAHDDARKRLAPHLALNVPEACSLMTREIFGPILPVVPYDTLDEVLQRINSGARPLAIYPFGNSASVVNHIIDHTLSGGVTVNDALMHVGQDDLPFGGVGESGMGHYHGYEGFLTFSKLRPISRQSRLSSLKLLRPPYGQVADKLLKFLLR